MNPFTYLRMIPVGYRTMDDFRIAARLNAWAPDACGLPSKLAWVCFLSNDLYQQWKAANPGWSM